MFPTTSIDSAVSTSRNRVGTAIAQASASAGVDFSYMMNQAKIESGLNPGARAGTSSATGLYQFLDQTWLGVVKKHGAEHGLGGAADSIQQGKDGHYRIADPATRQAVLNLRNDPEASASMAAEFAADNRDYLESKLGRTAEPVDLYMAHFLGAAGAAKFLDAADTNPDAPAAALAPAAARTNRAVFYNRDGSAKTLAEVRDHFAAKIGGDNTPSTMPATAPSLDNSTQLQLAAFDTGSQSLAKPSPQNAKLAYLMLAELGG